MTPDSFLFDAGWLFFAAWIVVIAGVSVAAFGRDFFPSTVPSEPPPRVRSHDSTKSGESGEHKPDSRKEHNGRNQRLAC